MNEYDQVKVDDFFKFLKETYHLEEMAVSEFSNYAKLYAANLEQNSDNLANLLTLSVWANQVIKNAPPSQLDNVTYMEAARQLAGVISLLTGQRAYDIQQGLAAKREELDL